MNNNPPLPAGPLVSGMGTGNSFATDRRTLLHFLLATLAPAPVLSSCSPSRAPEIIDGRFYDPLTFALVEAFADTLIPSGETPGALDAAVPEFMNDLMVSWASRVTREQHFFDWIKIDEALRGANGTTFAELSKGDQHAMLSDLDRRIFSESPPPVEAAYRRQKSLVTRSYYLSEAGATIELQYDPVPGEWVGCAPIETIGRTWAVE